MPAIGPFATPRKQDDLVLKHVQATMYRRILKMWKESGAGLDFHVWLAQKVEVEIAVRDFNQRHFSGVNASEPKRPVKRRFQKVPFELDLQQVAEVKAAVIAGRISSTSEIALAAAAAEEQS
jgi:hypothetical protein